MTTVNPRPVIKDLQPGDWIDLDVLGDGPLLTYIRYPDIALNDVLWPNWRGCGEQGEVADHSNFRVNVTVEGGYTPVLGMPVHVPNEVFKQLDQGWAFFSYAVGTPGDPDIRGAESLRFFCYVGKRTDVPPPQIKESHQLALDPDTLGSADASATVPPYRAMSVGDKVTFTWQGYFMGAPDIAYRESKLLTAEHLGHPLTFTVPFIDIIGIAGEYADISYLIEYTGGAGRLTESAVQRMHIIKSGSNRLPPMTVKDHKGGPINPSHYQNGLTLQVKPVHASLQIGDWLLVYWQGSEKAKSVTKALRVDRSTLDSGLIECVIEPRWITENINGPVTVGYQFAREGVAQSAESLALEISKPLNLPAPIVEGATPEAASKGWLAASTAGAYVFIPDAAEVGAGRVEMHWQGDPDGGCYVAPSPEPGNNKKYFIPATAIAANMSGSEQARFPVFYRVYPPGSSEGEDSVSFHLRIEPIPATRYPFTTSAQIRDNTLSLFAVPFSGAVLEIHSTPPHDAWPFMAEGQRVIMEVSGVNQSGGAVSTRVRNDLPVTAAEFNARKVTATLPKAFINTLKLNETFTLKARVSFDGGKTYTPFKDSTPVLVA